jgi:hypothetical protein
MFVELAERIPGSADLVAAEVEGEVSPGGPAGARLRLPRITNAGHLAPTSQEELVANREAPRPFRRACNLAAS